MGKFTTLTGAASIALAGATGATAETSDNSSPFSASLEQACDTALETMGNIHEDVLKNVNHSIQTIQDMEEDLWTSEFGNTYKSIVSSDKVPFPLPNDIRSEILSTSVPTDGMKIHAEFLDQQQASATATAIMTCNPTKLEF